MIGEVIEVLDTGNPVIEFYNDEKDEYIKRQISQDVIDFYFEKGTKVHFQSYIKDDKPGFTFEHYLDD